MSTLLPPPMPALEPLQLLYVTNGSPLTADRWWQAHYYYQHRQNLHYQSLHQPGIVRGLGVRVVPAPDTVPSELRDDRWIEIQPGIAIDLVGNPIVVDEPITFRITATVIDEPVTAYIVLAHVNPQSKEWSDLPAPIVKEEFRIDERSTLPAADEVELCRVVLTHNRSPLRQAAQVFTPGAHELDLRHRQQVKARSPQPVQVGVLAAPAEQRWRDRLTALLTTLPGLYPPLVSQPLVQTVRLDADDAARHPEQPTEQMPLTLLVVPYAAAIALSEPEVEQLQRYIAQGTTLLIEYASAQSPQTEGGSLGDLQTVLTEIDAALVDLVEVAADTDLGRIREALYEERTTCEAALQNHLHTILQPLRPLTQTVTADGTVHRAPPQDTLALTQRPFTFDALPHLPTGLIQMRSWEGLTVVIGDLSAAWLPGQFETPLTRETLRSAQELGINLLYQASLRQQMIQAQQSTHPEGNGRQATGDR